MRVMLTSCGLETRSLEKEFLKMLGKDAGEARALFIPTAAVDADSIAVLPKCMNDLIKCGIPKNNIHVYDLHENISMEEIRTFDVIYLCGGKTSYLLNRINETGFRDTLLTYINENGFVIDDDPLKIAEKMDYLFEHKDEAKRLGQNGRKSMDEKKRILRL